MRDRERFADFERHVPHDVAMFIPELIKFWIDRIVEDVELKQLNDFSRCVDPNGLLQFRKQVVDKDRQAGNVVHVRVRDNHITHSSALSLGRGDADTAGINRHSIINEKAGQTLRRIRAAAGIERTR